jgi:hypothetical protein
LIISIAAAAVVAVGAVALRIWSADAPAPSTATNAPSPPKATTAPAAGAFVVSYPAAADPNDLYLPARAKALQWNAKARLLSIAAQPLKDQAVDLTTPGAHIVYTFFAPKQDAVLARANQGEGRFVVTVTAAEATTNATAGAATDDRSGVDEPTCLFSLAAKAAHAAGLPSDAPAELTYARDATLARPVWIASVPGKPGSEQVVDGQSCAILRRL